MGELMSKQDRRYAEVAAQWLAVKEFECTYIRKAIRTKFQSVDFFGSDVMGINEYGHKVFIQATAGQDAAVTQRRRKLEKYPWHESDTVLVAILRKVKIGRSYHYHFRISEYDDKTWMYWSTNVEVPRHWFKKYQEQE